MSLWHWLSGLVVDLLAEWLTEVRCELPAVIQSARDPPFGPCEIAFPSRHIEIDGDARHPASAQLRSRHIHKLERPLAAVSLHFLQAICTLHNRLCLLHTTYTSAQTRPFIAASVPRAYPPPQPPASTSL
jgi:hypothetical protein